MTNTLTVTDFELFHTELKPRLENAVKSLLELREGRTPETVARLEAKAEAVSRVLRDQSERLDAVHDTDSLVMLASVILATSEQDEASLSGTKLAVSYMMELVR